MSDNEIRKILASKLKEYREKAGFSIKEVGLAIGKSEKTISAWEHERGQPDADMLFILYKLYKIDNISVFYGLSTEKNCLNSDEEELLALYRSFNSEGRMLALGNMRALSGNPDLQKDAHIAKAT